MAGFAVRIDLKTWLGANIVIKGQGRQEFKLVDDTSDTLDVHGGSLSAKYQRGQLDLAGKNHDVIPIQMEAYVGKDPSQRYELPANFLSQSRSIACQILVTVSNLL